MIEEKFRKCKKCWRTNPESEFEKVSVMLSVTQTEEYFKCPICNERDTEPAEPRYYIDIKETCWRRVTLDLGSGDDRISVKEFIEKLDKEGESAIWDHEGDSDVDSFESMTVEENGGNATMELYLDDGQYNGPIWGNGNYLTTSTGFSRFVHVNDEVL